MLIQERSGQIKVSFEVLLQDGSLRCNIDEQIVCHQLRQSEAAVWSLLLASAYSKALHVKAVSVESGEHAEHEQVPKNFEVQRMFRRMVYEWFEVSGKDYNGFVASLLDGDVDAMNIYMNRLACNVFSYFDTGKHNPDRSVFTMGLCLGLLWNIKIVIGLHQIVKADLADTILCWSLKIPCRTILSFWNLKYLNQGRKRVLADTVHAALEQIENRKYKEVLKGKGL